MELEYGEKVGSNIVQTEPLLGKYKNYGILKNCLICQAYVTLLGNRGFPQKDFIPFGLAV